ncbi:MAG: hypothetical protein JSW11_21475 [Candidatus Heimdallarchaeota archaeon]|nr:MAG: hypothetical protein JSW11_21475 [Candidatus Heimdallarchaeota archaeon]
MVYLRTTSLRRTFARYLNLYPDLFAGKLVEGLFLMKNTGNSMALILPEMQKHKGNIEVSILEPLRIEDFLEDSELGRMASWLKDKNRVHKVLQNEKNEQLPREITNLLQQVKRKRFSVQWKLT